MSETVTARAAIELSQRAKSIPPSLTLAISQRANDLKAQGRDILSFGTGEPDFATPANICAAASKALMEGDTHYAPVPGPLAAREAIAAKLRADNAITCTASDIVISPGAKMSINLALQVLVDPGCGHEVLMPTPCWVSYPAMIELAGATPVEISADARSGFMITPEELEAAITPNSRAIILNTPSNPCGTMYTPERLAQLAAVLERHEHVAIIADEIYEKLIYTDTPHFSLGAIPSIADRVITINGLSKAYAMTGWRLGYACVPGDGGAVAAAMGKLQSQLVTSATSFAMAAIPEAIGHSADAVNEMQKAFAQRAVLMEGLVGKWPEVTCTPPMGAFYVFPDVSGHFGKTSPSGKAISDSMSFAAALLDDTGVAVVPGGGFGGCGDNHVRLSFACGESQIQEGCNRICTWLQTLA
jgi:aspartate aminotransferase